MIRDRLKRRKYKIRQKISGTDQRPRLTVYKSLTSLYAQAIDDVAKRTLAAASVKGQKNMQGAEVLAEKMYATLAQAGIKRVSFDRNGKRYHGVIKMFAESLRSKGIEL